jgi:histidine triad (HIT) family protein
MNEINDCIICKLLSGELEVSMVYQDDVCSAFMDIQPVNPGHVLVVPNRHAPDLASLEEEEGTQIFRLAQRLATGLRSGVVRCEGVNFFLADGVAAGQEVFHVHLHVFPRYAGDGFRLVLPPTYSQRPQRKELDAVAEQIRRFLERTSTPLSR